jgi:two-component system sensor kinase FixL
MLSNWTPRKGRVLSLGAVTVLLLGVVDFVTGYEFGMFIFYGVPIFVVAWLADKKSAIQGWETFSRLAFFLFCAVSGSIIKRYYQTAESRIKLLEHARQLEHQIVQATEQEQRRIGQDLHDGICQYLVALGYSAASLEADLKTAGHIGWAAIARDLADRLKEGVVHIRDLSRGLIPVEIDDRGLASALEELATTTRRSVNIDCIFHDESCAAAYDHTTATHLYRIAQEAINNATRHGHADRIDIVLRGNGECWDLMITDNGVGIDTEQSNLTGVGLKIMEYRARCIGGRFSIARDTPGTIVRCTSAATNLEK